MAASAHFRDRVLQRCPIGTDPDRLADAITAAILAERWDLIERVMRTHRPTPGAPLRTIWRVRINGHSVYAIVCDQTSKPITVLTQEQIRATKAARKLRRKRELVERQMEADETQRHGKQRIVRLRKNKGLWR